MAIRAAGISKSPGSCVDISSPSTMGVVSRQAKEQMAVSAIDSATWPRARKVSTLDMVPPGMAAHRASPTATPVTGFASAISAQANSGTRTIWISRPKTSPRGFCTTTRKSRTCRVAPMPSMARASWVAANQYSWRI